MTAFDNGTTLPRKRGAFKIGTGTLQRKGYQSSSRKRVFKDVQCPYCQTKFIDTGSLHEHQFFCRKKTEAQNKPELKPVERAGT